MEPITKSEEAYIYIYIYILRKEVLSHLHLAFPVWQLRIVSLKKEKEYGIHWTVTRVTGNKNEKGDGLFILNLHL